MTTPTTRPTIRPGLVADLLSEAPARVQRRLDTEPDSATKWTWEIDPSGSVRIIVSPDAVVELRPVDNELTSPDQVSCSCLLNPKCFHLLAVATSLPLIREFDSDSDSLRPDNSEPGVVGFGDSAVVTGSAGDSLPANPEGVSGADQPHLELNELRPEAAASGIVELRVDDRRNAARMAEAAAALLEVGFRNADSVQTGELLRSVHDCRAAGLHRLATSGLRCAESLRMLRTNDPGFVIADAVIELAEVVDLGSRIANNLSGPSDIGTARRAYMPVGNLRLTGLATEPIDSGAGYAGAVTYLCSDDGRIWSVATVRPGVARDALAAYNGGVEIGEVTATHQQLGRSAMFVSNAAASGEGRLGRGRNVRAVRSDSRGWDAPAIAAKFAEPFQEQVERAWLAVRRPVDERVAGDDFMFVTAHLAGSTGSALLVVLRDDPSVTLAVVPGSFAPEFPAVDNLRLLSRAEDNICVRIMGRLIPQRGRHLEGMAIAVVENDRTLSLGSAFGGILNIGFDRLRGADIGLSSALAPGSEPIVGGVPPTDSAGNSTGTSVESPDWTGTPTGRVDPFELLVTRIQRSLLGGAMTLSVGDHRSILRDVEALRALGLVGAADRLSELAAAARSSRAELDGRRGPIDRAAFASRWTDAWAHVRAGTLSLQRSQW